MIQLWSIQNSIHKHVWKNVIKVFSVYSFYSFFLKWTLNIEQRTYIWIYVHAYILLNLSISMKINSINLLNELKEAKVFVNYEFCVCYGTALLEPPSKIPFQFLVSAWISRYKCRKIIIIIASIFDGKRLNICLHISWTYSNIDLRLWHLFQNKQSFWIDFIFFFWKSLTVLDIISKVKTIYFRQKYNICSLLRWPINRWNLKIDTYLFGYIFRIFLKIICKFTTAGEYRWKSHTFEIIELYLPLVEIHQNLFHDFSYQLYYILQTYMEFKNANGF